MNKIFDFLKKNKFHFIGWALFIIYEISAVGFVVGRYDYAINYLLHYTVNILLFYCHALVVLPYALNRSKNNIIVLCLTVTSEYILYFLICFFLIPFIAKIWVPEIIFSLKFDFRYFLHRIWKFVYYAGFASAYYFFRRLKIESKRNSELEKARFLNIVERKDIEQELIRSNYAYLRAQINPHFLFNLLNFLYDETKKYSTKAAKGMLLLSDMMRYGFGGLDKDEFVLILDEIEQVESLIYLNQLQFDNKPQIDFNYSDDVVHLEIIPLVLLTLVENMFKHGDLTILEEKASIDLYIEDNKFCITTNNSIGAKGFTSKQGAGLDRLRKRLEFAYKSVGELKCSINEGDDRFIVQINIPLLALANPVRIDNKALEESQNSLN